MESLKIASEFLRLVEGEELTAYRDSGGILTIGVGITKDYLPDLKDGLTITKEQSQALLMLALQDIASISLPGTAYQQAALLAFAYNTGWEPGKEGFDSLNYAIQSNSPFIPSILKKYCKVEGYVLYGLQYRRRAEGLLWYGNKPETAITRARLEYPL